MNHTVSRAFATLVKFFLNGHTLYTCRSLQVRSVKLKMKIVCCLKTHYNSRSSSLICRRSVTVMMDFNRRRHNGTKQASTSDDLNGAARNNKIEQLKKRSVSINSKLFAILNALKLEILPSGLQSLCIRAV